MAVIDWNEDFCFGLAEIDKQHRNLAEIINDLWAAWRQRQPCEILRTLLCQLHKYAAEHFIYEQEQMRATDYPHLAEHQLQHDVLLGEIRRLGRQTTRCDELIDEEFFAYLRNWHLEHTRDQDAMMAEHLHAVQTPG